MTESADSIKLDFKERWSWKKNVQEYETELKWPKISIITPSYNQAEYIEDTILSILLQNYPNLEYIIIDGESTDGSVDVIKKYDQYIDYWVSEKDNGQSHTINKGLKKCTGEIFNWINSDDVLAEGALKKIAEKFISQKKLDVVAGGVQEFGNNIIRRKDNENLSSENLITNPPTTCFHQPGIWVKLKQLKSISNIDESLHYCFDLDLYIRYYLKYPKTEYISSPLVHFRLHNNSKTVSFKTKFDLERAKILDNITKETNTLSENILKVIKKEIWRIELKHSAEKNLSSFLSILIKIVSRPSIRLNRYTIGFLKSFYL